MNQCVVKRAAATLLSFALLAISLVGPASAQNRAAVTLPNQIEASALVRSTLFSLHEANLASNYSVLRDASAPDFRLIYTEASLASIFEVLRTHKVDLAKAALINPVFKNVQYKMDQDIVIFDGVVPAEQSIGQPFDVSFHFSYQRVGVTWRLFALDLGFGLPPGSPSLGELLSQGKANIQAPWLGLAGFFSVAIMLSLLIFIGEAVRDAFDPRKTFR